MTVTQLHQLTEKWIKLGYGDKKVIQWYDCNFAAKGLNDPKQYRHSLTLNRRTY